MDELATRLKDTSDACMKAYDVWSGDKKASSSREALQEAVHELRKVAARLEIEVAVSERDANGKPLPIPGHRSHSKGGQKHSKKPNNNAASKGNEAVPEKSGQELPAFISGDDAKPKRKPAVKKSAEA